jgi:hypothetical protein
VRVAAPEHVRWVVIASPCQSRARLHYPALYQLAVLEHVQHATGILRGERGRRKLGKDGVQGDRFWDWAPPDASQPPPGPAALEPFGHDGQRLVAGAVSQGRFILGGQQRRFSGGLSCKSLADQIFLLAGAVTLRSARCFSDMASAE